MKPIPANLPDTDNHGPSQHAVIQRAVFAALGHVKPDYRSPGRLDKCASVIADFVEAELKAANTDTRDDIERLTRGILKIREYLETKPPRIGDATFDCEALLAGSQSERAPSMPQPQWVTDYEKKMMSDAGPRAGRPTEN